jgi:hypothetical protein
MSGRSDADAELLAGVWGPGRGIQFLNGEESGGERKGISISSGKITHEGLQARGPHDGEGFSVPKSGWISGCEKKVNQVCRVIRMKMGHEDRFNSGMIKACPFHAAERSGAYVQQDGRVAVKNGNGRGTPIVYGNARPCSKKKDFHSASPRFQFEA